MPFTVLPRRIEARSSALADEVHAVLAEAILDGRLAPGQRLRDVALAEHLGVSRTPVREALLRLERQGLIEVSAHRYTRVTEPSPTLQSEAVEFLGYVAGMGLRLGLPRMSDAQIAELAGLVDDILSAVEQRDEPRARQRSGELHRAIIHASGNRVYANVLDEYALPMRRFLSQWSPYEGDRDEAIDSYRALMRAIRARDGVVAETILRAQHGLA